MKNVNMIFFNNYGFTLFLFYIFGGFLGLTVLEHVPCPCADTSAILKSVCVQFYVFLTTVSMLHIVRTLNNHLAFKFHFKDVLHATYVIMLCKR